MRHETIRSIICPRTIIHDRYIDLSYTTALVAELNILSVGTLYWTVNLFSTAQNAFVLSSLREAQAMDTYSSTAGYKAAYELYKRVQINEGPE